MWSLNQVITYYIKLPFKDEEILVFQRIVHLTQNNKYEESSYRAFFITVVLH